MKTITSNPVDWDLTALALAALTALDGVVVDGCAEPTCEVCARVLEIAA